MKIGIIGAGQIGGTLAGLSGLGHEVCIAGSQPGIPGEVRESGGGYLVGASSKIWGLLPR
jgi:prephenate dehydrogenase